MSNFLCEFIFVWYNLLLWTIYVFYTFLCAFLPEDFAGTTVWEFIFTCGLSTSHFIDSMTKSCLSFFTQINFLTAFLEMSDIQYDRQNCVSNFHLSFHVHTAERGSNSWYLYKHNSAYLGSLS